VKAQWLHWAEVFDSWRVVPRLLLASYAAFVYHVTDYILAWYTHEPAVARGSEETAAIVGIFTAVTGFGSFVFKVYSDNGRDWNSRPVEAPKDGV
jgi:hypothetical protein